MAKKKDTGATGTALINVEQEMLALANVAKSTEESVQTGQFFGTKGGILTFNGSPIKDNKMQVIILDHILANMLYQGKFDANNPAPPVCYAFGRTDAEMKPHEKSGDKQSEACRGCEHNDYGTADTGRGKACKNSRRLACISADLIDNPGNIADAQVAYLGVPVTSTKGWAGYVRQVADLIKRPPLGVITEVSLVPDAAHQFKMTFRSVEAINDKKILGLLIAKQKVVANEIAFPFPEIEERPARAPAKGNKRGPAKGGGGVGARAAGGFGARPKHAR